MTIPEAIILAIIEGLTEFLPVSSTGHMIIASSLMGIESDPFTKMFTVAIQLGAIFSVIMMYWEKFIPSNSLQETFLFYVRLLIACMPAFIIGYLFEDYIDALLENVQVVGIALIAGGIIFLYIDKFFNTDQNKEDKPLSYTGALIIGLFQTVAMIPGVSRSAATIIGGLFQGMNKRSAAEFSFFLAVPTMFAATLWKMYSFYKDGEVFGAREVTMLLIGNVVAFVVAIIAIRSFITFLTRHGFKMFGYYRIVLGAIILLLYYLGVELSIV